jgi:hypothetical protein
LEDLHDSDPHAFFVHCLDLSGIDDLPYLACIGVVCTAEMIHALLCRYRPGMPPWAGPWIAAHRNLVVRPLVPAAIAGLRRVLEVDSEMHQRWQDNEEFYDCWLEGVNDLLERLEKVATRPVK